MISILASLFLEHTVYRDLLTNVALIFDVYLTHWLEIGLVTIKIILIVNFLKIND